MSGELDDVPTVAELRAAGFTPIEELTGQVELAEVWPEAHRRAVPDTRYEPDAATARIPGLTDGLLYLIRSPWPSVTTEEAVLLVQRWQRKHRPASDPASVVRIDRESEPALAKAFLDQDERWIRAYREGHVRPSVR
jgi:hypothetical protein